MAANGTAGASAVYGLKLGARAVSAVLGATDAHRFVVGTNSCKDKSQSNELHVIEFNDDTNAVACQSIFSHSSGEVWGLAPHPTKADLLITSYRTPATAVATATAAAAAASNNSAAGASAAVAATSSPAVDNHRVSLWKMKEETNKAEALSKLDECVEFTGHSGSIRSLVWSPSGERVVTCDQTTVRVWNVESGSTTNTTAVASAKPAASTPAGTPYSALNGGAWDPHRPDQFTVLNDRSIRCIDLRTMKESSAMAAAHGDTIRDIDYNPNKPSYIVTCGDDRLIRFWDIRKFNAPLRVLSGHTHWVSTVRYNRAHDQLVLSGSTDSSVKLWNIVSISSAPLGELEDPANEKEGDKLIRTYDDHEDSVYAVSWSAKDAWVFASVSHGGQVVFNHVPQAEKYKILL